MFELKVTIVCLTEYFKFVTIVMFFKSSENVIIIIALNIN
jgi:hypothetical protein